MTDHPLADWLSREQAAQLLRRTTRTLDRMIMNGQIAAVKQGQEVYVPRKSLNDWVARKESEAAKVQAERAAAAKKRNKTKVVA